MSILKKLYNKSKEEKGFTLVELIVVLVIIAILAAILVPSLLKYIDTAKGKQASIDARTAYLGIQTAVTEQYATKPSDIPSGPQTLTNDPSKSTNGATAVKATPYVDGIKKKYECTFTVSTSGAISDFTYNATDDGVIIKLTSGGALQVQ
ncbi:MAG: type II secretion system protein [bacterium]|nr:type II secretion system protein [bacterium]